MRRISAAGGPSCGSVMGDFWVTATASGARRDGRVYVSVPASRGCPTRTLALEARQNDLTFAFSDFDNEASHIDYFLLRHRDMYELAIRHHSAYCLRHQQEIWLDE